jgi:hypothetical protein
VSSSPTPSDLAGFARRSAASTACGEYESLTSEDDSAEEDEEIVRVQKISSCAFRYARRGGHMAALLFLVTMAVPGDASVLPLPAQFGLHHLAGCSSFFFVLGGAPAYLGTFMFSLLTTLVCIAVFAYYFKAYHTRLHLDAAGNDAPPVGRRRRWAARPFIPGVIKPCSVTVDGEMCGWPTPPHRLFIATGCQGREGPTQAPSPRRTCGWSQDRHLLFVGGCPAPRHWLPWC